jgi:hypothetical protein
MADRHEDAGRGGWTYIIHAWRFQCGVTG